MTAGEIAAATGLGRATVSTTLSKLASSGEIAKAARGYQLGRESDRTRKPARRRSSTSTDATSPSPEPVEPEAVEPEAVEPDAVEAQAVEPDAAEPDAAEPLAVEPDVAEPLAVEPDAAEPEAVEPESAEPPSAGGAVGSAARPAPGATKHAVLAALAGGSAMTAGEVASATGLARASVSTTLSRLATAGEVTKAARGYQLAGVEPAQRFYFLIEDDVTPRAVVANLPELEAAIAVCGPGVLRHHCAEHDFSRWVAGVFHNEPLAAEIAAAEAQLSADSPTETIEQTRLALITVLQARQPTQQ
jgi:DNA-binding transcriptional ArsR family regulator